MIAHLSGSVIWKDEDHVIIEVRGVGYELTCSQATLEACKEGAQATLWVYTHVREDSLQLFGFATPAEKQLFLSLIKVNGIGPKMAVTILSAGTVNALSQAIDSSDVGYLTKLPKVGKKIAEQMILSLKGKLPAVAAGAAAPVNRTQIKSALVNLGFRPYDVDLALEKMDPSVDVQEGLRLGLSLLTQST